MQRPARSAASLAFALFLIARYAGAHSVGSLGAEPLNWHTDQIARVVSQASSFGNLGLLAFGGPADVVQIDGRQCLRGNLLGMDVRDDLAFDIDETVELELELEAADGRTTVTIAYDKNGAADGIVSFNVPPQRDTRLHVESIVLERARFAGRGDFGTDLMIWSPERTAICGLKITRTFETPLPSGFGWLELSVYDEHGARTPARVGLYDESSRTPLPSSSALEVEEFDDRTRMVLLRQEPGTRQWPSLNRWVFYTDGGYKTRAPAGEYDIVIAKGIEYRIARRTVRIEPGETFDLTVTMDRWADLPSRGWYSGDVHIHLAQRDGGDGLAILTKARAEDLHVANSLQMGNMGATHFVQRAWGRGGRTQQDDYTVVPGQEDPRTAIRGHTIHLDIPQPVRDPSRYLLYHELFERVSALGGISGYAHIGGVAGALGGDVGLALEVPFGLVDFVEILQAGGLGTDLWFDFLNLGYRIAPAAGSDYPYIGHVGEVRTYVKLPDGYDPDAWFDNLAAGRSFVSNGPILRFDLNGAEAGAALSLAAGETISVSAQASINPDVDLLERLVLIEQGDVVAEAASAAGAQTLELEYTARADHGTWFVIKASGRTDTNTPIFGPRRVEAVSAPIYVSVDGQKTWKASQVRALAERRKSQLDAFANASVGSIQGAETWQDGELLNANWLRQLALLSTRIDQAKASYDELIELAE